MHDCVRQLVCVRHLRVLTDGGIQEIRRVDSPQAGYSQKSQACRGYSVATTMISWVNNHFFRLPSEGRMISISKTCFSLKIDNLIHKWTSKRICPIRYTQYLYFWFWKSRKWLYLRPQQSTRSRPPKAADFFGCFVVFCTIISWTPKIKKIDIEYI